MNLILIAFGIYAGLAFGVTHASSSPANGSCQAQMTAFPLDPGSKCCSHGHKITTLGGNNSLSNIDQHPWAVLIDYELHNKGETKRLCSGTLISARYVLTAAQCIIGEVLDIATPTKVRLGEYDSNHEGPDCVSVPGAEEDCTDGAISIEIETTIPFPKYYYPGHPSKWNDVGLIRLKEAAPYTDFIRPICLPTKNPETIPPNHSLYAVGWNQDNVKVIYEVPFVNEEKCKPIYSKRNVVLVDGQICAGGIEGMDPCRGDGGGPLVNVNNERLAELAGIVSFGPIPCGKKDIPSVYTNVYEYLDWIRTIIKA